MRFQRILSLSKNYTADNFVKNLNKRSVLCGSLDNPHFYHVQLGARSYSKSLYSNFRCCKIWRFFKPWRLNPHHETLRSGITAAQPDYFVSVKVYKKIAFQITEITFFYKELTQTLSLTHMTIWKCPVLRIAVPSSTFICRVFTRNHISMYCIAKILKIFLLMNESSLLDKIWRWNW